MRYDDASQQGSADNSGTDARNDADTLAAGSRNAATGNTITGAGTQTGAAGADVVGNAPAQVVAIEGAGGADASFSGGQLNVAGRFGTLSMREDGSYTYRTEGPAPERASDVFNYTIADASGARDTASLTIDIGHTPALADNAQQMVVGPDGVVTLPPGVELSDIRVVGRNLVIDMPDGSQMVIVDGAIFVPQLVLGGVEVPASNVAALLIDSEPQPAAGTPQSSGGNFQVPVGPLDPGVPLGDLIPPTELTYTPPTFEEVGQVLDRDPEIFIDPGNGVPTIAAVDSVNESGLPARVINGQQEPAGSAASGSGETTTGTIVYNSPDDPNVVSITLNGVTTPITAVGQTFQGQYGVLTITSIADGAIGYSYTLSDNTSGDTTHDDFLVSIVDNDGDTASATLRIDIVDDVPTANADSDSVKEDGPTVATGNILTGVDVANGDANGTDGVADVTGADGATLTGFSGAGGNGTFGVALAGQYGSLVLNANGTYTYTLNNLNAAVQGLDDGETLTETYNYTITDGDGDVRSTTLTITINGTNDAPVAVSDSNWVQEDGPLSATGNVLQNIAHPGDPSPTLEFADRADTDLDGEALTVTPQTVNGLYGTLVLNADGSYTYTLYTQAQNAAAYALVQGLDDGETLQESFPYTASDGTASASSTLTVTVFGRNDAPVAQSDSNWVQEDGPLSATGNVLQNIAHPGDPSPTLEFADRADSDLDGDTLTVTPQTVNGLYGTLVLNADGSYTYTLYTQAQNAAAYALVQGLDDGETLTESFPYTASDGTASVGSTLSITVFGNNDAPVAQSDSNWVQEDGPLSATGNVLQNIAHPGDPSPTLEFADRADSDLDGDTLTVTPQTVNGLYGTLVLNADGSYTYTLYTQAQNAAAYALVQGLDDGETLTESFPYTASDGTASVNSTLSITVFGNNDAPVAQTDSNWVQEDGPLSATGNVLQNIAHPGDPSPTLSFADRADTDVDGDTLTVTPQTVNGQYGTLVLNADGSYTYTLYTQAQNAAAYALVQGLDDGETLTETFPYTASDGTASVNSSLAITVFGNNDAPVAQPDTNWVKEDGPLSATGNVLQNIAHPGDPSPTVDFQDRADSDVDGEALSVTPQSVNGLYGTLVLNSDGTYTYTLYTQAQNPAAYATVQALGANETLQESFNYTVSDGTASVGSTLTITVFGNNDLPTGAAGTATVSEEGLPGGIPDSNPIPSDNSNSASDLDGDLNFVDPDGDAVTYSLGIPSGQVLDAATNQPLVWSIQTVGNVQTLTGSVGGQTAISVTLDTVTGEYDVVLSRPLEHTTGDNLETEFNIVVPVTVSDGTGSVPTTITIDVEDDSPTAGAGTISLVVDEDGLQGGNPGGVNDVAGEFTTRSGNAGALAVLFNSGGDRPLTYSLTQDPSGLPVLYSQGDLVTYEVSPDGTTLTATADGRVVFTFVVGSDGSYTFTLRDQLDHPALEGTAGDDTENPTLDDIYVDLGAAIQATDADGDSVQGAGGSFVVQIDDDSPDPWTNAPGMASGVNAPGTSDTESLNLPDVGADEPYTLTFGVANGSPVLDSDGQPVSSNGQPLYYTVNPNDPTILEARTSATPGEGELIFQIDVNGDSYTYTQIGEITSVSTLSITNLSSVGGGNVDAKAINVPGEFDLLLSTDSSGGSTVNTNSTEIGIGTGQSFTAGEALRVDFIRNVSVEGSGGSATINYGEYYAANSYRQDVSLTGNSSQNADFIVRAIVVEEAPGSVEASPADGDNDFFNDANDGYLPSSALTVSIYDEAGNLVADPAAEGIIITAVTDGYLIQNLPDGYDFKISSSTLFNGVRIEAVAGTDEFKLGIIDITTVVQTDVTLTVPVELSDFDGDAVSSVITIDLTPGVSSVNQSVLVNEAGLPTGTNAVANTEVAGGTLVGSGGTGPYTFAIAGATDNGDGTFTADGDYGNLVYNPLTGAYTYTLDTAYDGATANNGVTIEFGAESFIYAMTDSKGLVAQGTITVNIVDDVPTANADSDSVTEDTILVADGNVLTGSGGDDLNGSDGTPDTFGADRPATVVGVGFGAGAQVAPGTTIAGKYGTLVLNADGGYTYTLDPTDPDYAEIQGLGDGDFVNELFTYTMADADGDRSSSTLTIRINGINDAPTGSAGTAVVSEEGLPGGVQDSQPFPIDTGSSASYLNGDLNFTDADGDALTYSLSAPLGTYRDAAGNLVTWQVVDTATGQNLIGSSSAGEVIRVSLNETTGEYSVVLSRGMDHGDDSNTESEFDITVPVTVSDGNGSNVPTSITVNVEDDMPDVSGKTPTSPAVLAVTDANFAVDATASFAGYFDVKYGGDGAAATNALVYTLGINAGTTGLIDTLTKQAVMLSLNNGTVEGKNANGDIVFVVSVDENGTVTLDQRRAVVHEDAALNPSNAPETLNAADLITLTATAEDADGDSDGHTVNIGQTMTFGDALPFINIDAVDPTNVKANTFDAATLSGPSVSTADFSSAFVNTQVTIGNDGWLNGVANVVTKSYSLVLDTLYTEGSATTLKSGGQTIYLYQNAATGVITGSTVGGNEAGVSLANTVFTVSVNSSGVVTLTQYKPIDHAAPTDGTDATIPTDLINLVQTASITDGDRDTATDIAFIDLNGNLVFTDAGPVGANDTDSLAPGDFGVATGNVLTGIEVNAGIEDSNDSDGVADNFGPDVPARVSAVSFTLNDADPNTNSATQTITAGGSVTINGQYGVLTLFSNGDYSYDRNAGSAGGVSDTFTYTLVDFDGDTSTATLKINIGSNPPSATGAAAAVDDDGLTGANAAGNNDINANTYPLIADLDGALSSEASFRGNLGYTGGDGTVSFALVKPADGMVIGQETVNFSLVGNVLTATIATSPAGRTGPLFTVTLDPATGQYVVQLSDNVLHGDDATDDEDGVEVAANIGYTVTDGSGIPSTGALNIVFNDDVPSATDVSKTQTAENAVVTVDITGAVTPGADGVSFTSGVTYSAHTGTGTLSYNNGVFTYQPGAAETGNVTFNYTVKDADGDAVTKAVTITLLADSTPKTVDVAAAVDDDGLFVPADPILEAGNGDINANTFTNPADLDGALSSEASFSGQINVDFGNDAGTVSFVNLNGQFGTVGTERVQYSWDGASNTLTATVTAKAGDGVTDQARSGTEVFEVVLSPSGAYTVNLLDNVLHSSASAENSTSVDLNYLAKDADSPGVTGKLSITFNDDTPTLGTIQNGTANNSAAAPVTTGTLNFSIGADGPGDVTGITLNTTGLTSGQKAVVTNFDSVTNTLTAYQDANNSGGYDSGDTVKVFTLAVDPSGNGQYVFDLITPFDGTPVPVAIGGSASFGAGPTEQGQILTSGTGQALSVVSGYHVTGSFDVNAWLAGTNLTSGQIVTRGVNGSTAGWGIDDNNFNGKNELFLFDFGSGALANPDGAGTGYEPPAGTTLPNITYATFDFINYSAGAGEAGDDILYVVHYTDGTYDSGFVPDVNINGAEWTFTADAGKFIADVQFFSGPTETYKEGGKTVTQPQDLPSGKIDLVSVGVQNSTIDKTLNFTVGLTDADGDVVSGSFNINVKDGNTASTATLSSTSMTTMMASKDAIGDDSASLLSFSLESQKQQVHANNNAAFMGAVAAAGMMALPTTAAAATFSLSAEFASHNASVALSAQQFGGIESAMTSRVSIEPMNSLDVHAQMGLQFSGHGESRQAVDLGLDFAGHQLAQQPTMSALASGTAMPTPQAAQLAMSTAADIVMPSAAQMAAMIAPQQAGGIDAVQSNAVIGKVLVDALQGGGHTIDVGALVDALPGSGSHMSGGANSALQVIASHNAAGVPAWDSAVFAGFSSSHFAVAAEQLHHDAAPQAA